MFIIRKGDRHLVQLVRILQLCNLSKEYKLAPLSRPILGALHPRIDARKVQDTRKVAARLFPYLPGYGIENGMVARLESAARKVPFFPDTDLSARSRHVARQEDGDVVVAALLF
jgi:hypothetical protein